MLARKKDMTAPESASFQFSMSIACKDFSGNSEFNIAFFRGALFDVTFVNHP
jgi:hypothetical protein